MLTEFPNVPLFTKFGTVLFNEIRSLATAKFGKIADMMLGTYGRVHLITENKKPDKSHWDVIKDNYKKENPDIKLMGDKFIGPNEQ